MDMDDDMCDEDIADRDIDDHSTAEDDAKSGVQAVQGVNGSSHGNSFIEAQTKSTRMWSGGTVN